MSSVVENVILEYLMKQNRPYSVADIFNNLHEEHGKTAIQKALDVLVDIRKIREKLYGKQKVYVANQDRFDDAVLQSTLMELDTHIMDLKEKVSVHTNSFRGSEAHLSFLVSTLVTIEAKESLANAKKQALNLDEKLQSTEQSVQNPLKPEVNPEVMMQIAKEREKFLKEWRTRKRIANEMIDLVLDGFPNGKKGLFEDLGIETDDLDVK